MNPMVFQIARAVIPPIARVLCAPAGYARIGSIESVNKISTIETVEFTNLFLGKDASLAELIDKILRYERHRSLWLAEGLGQLFGNRVMARDENPRDLLTKGEGTQIPENLQLMVHAGLCLAFARHHFDKIGKSASRAQIRDATCRIVELAQLNLLPGYAGIGYEAWGMVTQFFYRKMFATAVETMQEIDPAHAPHLWHGAGRACYFTNFMPRWNEPWPVFVHIRQMAKDDVSRHNMLAGLASAMILVNIRTPVILEAVVRERIARLSPDDAAAYAQGVICAIVLRLDNTPNEENTLRFIRHTPAPDVAAQWEKVAAGPARLAAENLLPRLKAQRRIEEVTCYCPVEKLLAD
jgi:hypothetical protein